MPQAHAIKPAAKRVLQVFQHQNRSLDLNEGARDKARSLETLYQVKAAMSSDRGDDDDAAAWGIAPWMLGVLTGLLTAWDIFADQGAQVAADDSPIIVGQPTVRRARALLDTLQAERAVWSVDVESRVSTDRVREDRAVSAEFSSRPNTLNPLPMGMASFPLTQPSTTGAVETAGTVTDRQLTDSSGTGCRRGPALSAAEPWFRAITGGGASPGGRRRRGCRK